MSEYIKKIFILTILMIHPITAHSKSEYFNSDSANEKFSFNSDDNVKNQKTRYTLSPVQSILVGIPSGCLIGIIAGTSIHTDSYYTMLNAFRGAMIGMNITPFLQYEIARSTKGISNKLNHWAFCFGSNLTFTSYRDVKIQPGFSSGLNRYYYINKRLDIVYSLYYSLYRFKSPGKIVSYFSIDHYKVENTDIEFSAHYLEVFLLLNYKLQIAKTQLHFAIGPFVSTQFLENTKYSSHWSEEFDRYEPAKYQADYHYNDDEVVGTMPCTGFAVNLGLALDKFMVQIRYNNSFYKSNHIHALSPLTKINTISAVLGFIL